MNENFTAIAIVVDRSGSVVNMKNEMENSINNLVKEQAKLPGELMIHLVQFDNEYDVVYSRRGKRFPKYVLEPRGMTALQDAIGRTIASFGEILADLTEDQRPGKVLFVVVTDGLENSSVEYTSSYVAEMIKRQKEVYNWEFIYLGANQDAILTGGKYGFDKGNSLTYNTASVDSAFKVVSGLAINYRSGGELKEFTEEDRNNVQ